MNYDFRDSNVGFKTQHIPKIDMRKFDLHDVPHTQGTNCIFILEQNHFVWYRWFVLINQLSLGQFLWKNW